MSKFSLVTLIVISLFLSACGGKMIEPIPSPTQVVVNAAPAASSPTLNASPLPAATASLPSKNIPTQDTSKIANPASKNCIEKGGKLEIRTKADGSQYGVCVFPNGSECEEWAFFRGECNPDQTANLVYNDATYAFSLSYPPSWKMDKKEAGGKTPYTLSFKNENNLLTVQVKRDSETTVIEATPPEGGEISQIGTLTVLGQDTPIQVVKLEGVIKSAAADVKNGDLQFHFQIDNPTDPEISTSILKDAQTIISSLKLTQ